MLLYHEPVCYTFIAFHHAPPLLDLEEIQRDNLQLFRNRLLTFQDYTNPVVPVEKLAMAGFQRHGNTIYCGFCGLEFAASYSSSFDPLSLHRAHSIEGCYFLLKDKDVAFGKEFTVQ